MEIDELKQNIEREITNAKETTSIKSLAYHYQKINSMCDNYSKENPDQKPKVESIRKTSLSSLTQITTQSITNLLSQNYTQIKQNENKSTF